MFAHGMFLRETLYKPQKRSLEVILVDEGITEKLGHPVRVTSFFPSIHTMKIIGENKKMVLSYKLTGEKGTGTMTSTLEKVHEQWVLKQYELQDSSKNMSTKIFKENNII